MLFDIKRILVCTDLTPLSDSVLVEAEVIRKRVACEMDILFVSKDGTNLESQLRGQIKNTAVIGHPIFLYGEPVEVINEHVLSSHFKYDLLIIGHSSKLRYSLLHLGSVARKILSDTPIPVIVIKKKIIFDSIACLIDSSRPFDWLILTALDFYRILKFKKVEFISVINLDEDSKILSEQLDEVARYNCHSNENTFIRVEKIKKLPVSSQLANIISQDRIDLAILNRNRGKRIEKKFLGSETLRILEKETCNILVMPI